jgi:DNA polymerase III sliding clamp (beta) subunit (PCNA family)
MASSAPTATLQFAGKQLSPALSASAGDGRVRLVFSPGRLEMSASGAESTLTIAAPVEGDATGEAIVRGSMFAGFLSAADGETIDITLEDGLKLHSGGGEMDLPGDPPDSWYGLEHATEAKATWDSSALSQIGRVTHAASTKESHQAMRGVCFANGKAVATDASQLAAVDVAIGFDESLVIPAAALEVVRRLHDGMEPITVCTSGRSFTFRSQSWQFTTTLILEAFPDWPAAIPPPADPALVAFRDQFLGALKKVRIVAEKDLLNKVHIDRLDDEWLRAWAHLPDVGRHEEIFQGMLHLDHVLFNLDRLVPAIENLQQEVVSIEMAGPMKPAVIRSAGYLASVMPIRG